MQEEAYLRNPVVFTFQKEGRCNRYLVNDSFPIYFLYF